ncbi:hypothetical protein CPT_Seuss74 [Caulobacter phage Seuss]|uniref:Uncharacterized protein n=1 Tax=Caulobacter phage Seuss TaxID=1675601 RepID=A0A0K1LN85_9CAUD|nr:hypothetical protein HOR08_gp074 [Caulobacter phage Seuss]AKU43600.1 hypothetical protein CPT_Seuss74 [Caulobacter phage Seuss]
MTWNSGFQTKAGEIKQRWLKGNDEQNRFVDSMQPRAPRTISIEFRRNDADRRQPTSVVTAQFCGDPKPGRPLAGASKEEILAYNLMIIRGHDASTYLTL